jgi:putative oxidoreductase
MQDIGKLILRLTVAGLILFHGIHKVLFGIERMSHNFGALQFFAYAVYIGEVVAPLLIILGLWTRIAGMVVVVNMIVAIGVSAWHLAFVIKNTGGWGIELEAFYLLTALAVFFLGPGRFRVGADNRTCLQ